MVPDPINPGGNQDIVAVAEVFPQGMLRWAMSWCLGYVSSPGVVLHGYVGSCWEVRWPMAVC